MKKTVTLEGIAQDVHDILMPYVAVNSETSTNGEKSSEEFVLNYLSGIPYFNQHPEYFGAYKIQEDLLDRAVTWGMVKGQDSETVVLLHHNDVVGVEDFKTLRGVAFSPEKLEKELMKFADKLQPEARKDLESGQYLFGRGAADMKGGGSIQLALLKRYSELQEMKGNIIVLSLPDEENTSAGMRAAVNLLTELKQKFDLKYVYAINSEPHQRKDANTGMLSEGSVGKMLPFVYVRGFLAHCGKIFEGLNPLGLLTEIAAQMELSPLFSDKVGGESAPPPTWLYLRDRKENYDVSIPLGAGGCVSVLTLDSDPPRVLDLLQKVALKSFETVIKRMNERYRVFCGNIGRQVEELPWKASVTTYADLLNEAYAEHGDPFLHSYEEELKEVCSKISNGELELIESSFVLVEFVYNYISDLSPRVVLGFTPPYYPNVSNLLLDERADEERSMADTISDYSFEKFGQRYDREYYYTGISDLSYFALKNSSRIGEELNDNMPLYGNCYFIPLEEIEELSMPCINIGPWGKDFHKMTERVYKQDLYERTPALVDRAIKIMLKHDLMANCQIK